MATDETLDTANCFLIPGRFGSPQLHVFGGLLNGVLGSTHHNVASAKFDVGTVMAVTQKGNTSGSRKGMTEFVYGQYDTLTGGPAMAVGQTAVSISNAGGNALHTFTNYQDYSSASFFTNLAVYQAFGVICLSEMTDGYYGWFWSGGVAPEDFITALTGGVIVTDGGVVEGVFCTDTMSATGVMGIGPYDDSVATELMLAAATGVTWYVPMGFALAADA